MAGPIPFVLDARAGSWEGKILYNGIRFPPATKAKATFTPVYDTANRMVKYYKATINVECIVFPGMLEAISSSHSPYTGADTLLYDDPQSVNESGGALPNALATDSELDEIRARLLVPGQAFSFEGQGAGDIRVNFPNEVRDLDNGPKPKLLKWTPLTNKLARIEWEVEVAFAPCDLTPSTAGLIAEFTFSVDMQISEDGLTTRTITGVMEVPMGFLTSSGTTNNPPTGTGLPSPSVTPFSFKEYEAKILKVFPLLKQFSRQQKYKLSEDRKYVNFTLVDKEFPHDDPLGEGCAKESVNITTESTLDDTGKGGGFSRWSSTLEGTIRLLPGYNKGYAYAEMDRLFTKYYIDAVKNARGPLNPIKNANPQTQNPLRYSPSATGILRKIKISDSIFDRSIGFAYSWDIFTDIADMLVATGLFKPLYNTPEDQDKGWGLWRGKLSGLLANGGWQGLDFNEYDDVIVSVCQPWSQGVINPEPKQRKPREKRARDLKEKRLRELKKRTDAIKAQNAAKKNALFSKYKQAIIVNVEHNSTVHRPLQHLLPALETLTFAQQGKKNIALPGKSGPDIPSNLLNRIGERVYTVTYVGETECLESPGQVPGIRYCSKKACYPIGTDTIIQQQIGNGIDIEQGQSYALYNVQWIKSYVLLDPPDILDLGTDGDVHSLG